MSRSSILVAALLASLSVLAVPVSDIVGTATCTPVTTFGVANPIYYSYAIEDNGGIIGSPTFIADTQLFVNRSAGTTKSCDTIGMPTYTFESCDSTFMGYETVTTGAGEAIHYGHIVNVETGECLTAMNAELAHPYLAPCYYSDDSGQLLQYWALGGIYKPVSTPYPTALYFVGEMYSSNDTQGLGEAMTAAKYGGSGSVFVVDLVPQNDTPHKLYLETAANCQS